MSSRPAGRALLNYTGCINKRLDDIVLYCSREKCSSSTSQGSLWAGWTFICRVRLLDAARSVPFVCFYMRRAGRMDERHDWHTHTSAPSR